MGSILWCPHPVILGEQGTYCVVAIKSKMTGFIHIDWVYFVSVRYSILYLIPWMHVGQRSMGGVMQQMQVGDGLLVSDVMPIYMIIALNIVITMHFSINCPTVICSPTVLYVLKREASSENYSPGSTFIMYKIQQYIAAILFTAILFCNLSICLPL